MLRQTLDQLSMAWLVAKRELRDQFRDWRVIVPMVFLTVFFPFLMNATAKAALDFTMRYGTPIIARSAGTCRGCGCATGCTSGSRSRLRLRPASLARG